jgi:hypothetical protein
VLDSKQAKAKAMRKVQEALPVSETKKVEMVRQTAEDLGLIEPRKTYQRNTQSIPSDT